MQRGDQFIQLGDDRLQLRLRGRIGDGERQRRDPIRIVRGGIVDGVRHAVHRRQAMKPGNRIHSWFHRFLSSLLAAAVLVLVC